MYFFTQIAMHFRPDLVEPLLRLGLDFYAENQDGEAAYMVQRWLADGNETIPRLLLSKGIYDDVVDNKMTWWTMSSMMGNARVFDLLVHRCFPRFYQCSLARRIQMLNGCYVRHLDPKAIGRIFHPDGRFRPGDLCWRPGPSLGKTIFERLLDVYLTMRFHIWTVRTKSRTRCGCTDVCTAAFGKHDPGISPMLNVQILAHQWSKMRVIMREAVSVIDYDDFYDFRTTTGRTALLEGMAFFRRRMQGHTGPRQCRFWRHEIQEMVRDWVEDLEAVGQDLRVYGRMELAAFLDHTPSRQGRWFGGPRKAGYKWSGFTVGPRPEDWTLRWEWDPDVEGVVGEFWAHIEDPPLAVPGSWPEVDDDSDSDDLYTSYQTWLLGACEMVSVDDEDE